MSKKDGELLTLEDIDAIEWFNGIMRMSYNGETHSTTKVKQLFKALNECGFGYVCGYLDLDSRNSLRKILDNPNMIKLFTRHLDSGVRREQIDITTNETLAEYHSKVGGDQYKRDKTWEALDS
jgi:hypothetical protein